MKVADMHCDTLWEILKAKKQGEEISLSKNKLHINLEKMKKGDYLVQNFGIFTHLPPVSIRSAMVLLSVMLSSTKLTIQVQSLISRATST